MISTVTCGQLVVMAGNASQRKETLPLLAQGKLIMSLALHEDGVGFGEEQFSTQVAPKDGRYRLNGVKTFHTLRSIGGHADMRRPWAGVWGRNPGFSVGQGKWRLD